MKNNIQTYIQLYAGNVELNIAVTDDLKPQEDNLKNFGHIVVSNGQLNSEDCFWDNLTFFFEIDKRAFKKDCKKELESKGFDVKETYKDIKQLLKRAFKLKILTA